MIQPFECKYCGKKFHKANTLTTHLCVKKQRFLDINSAGSRIGLRAFQRFYELTTKQKSKTTEDFINSSYYIDFVKFGNYIALLSPIYIEKYIDFVIMNSIKLSDWTKDYVFNTYIEDFIKKEPAISATERTIVEILEFCEKTNTEFNKFFTDISPNQASFLIKTGKISPWVLYLSSSGGDLLDRFNEDHSKIVGNIIDPGFWMKKFKKDSDDVSYIKDLLEQSGL